MPREAGSKPSVPRAGRALSAVRLRAKGSAVPFRRPQILDVAANDPARASSPGSPATASDEAEAFRTFLQFFSASGSRSLSEKDSGPTCESCWSFASRVAAPWVRALEVRLVPTPLGSSARGPAVVSKISVRSNPPYLSPPQHPVLRPGRQIPTSEPRQTGLTSRDLLL